VISVLLERKEHDTDHIKPAYKIETLMEISDLLSKL